MVNGLRPSSLGLEGRKILVAGAARGIGKATAIWISKLGARVVPADIRDCSATAEACGGVEPLRLDVSDRKEVEAAVSRLDGADGPLYGVVNCAGLLLRRPLEETSSEELELQTAANQIGALHLASAAHRTMCDRGEGRIVLFTSQGAFTGGFMGSVPYAMNKAAVGALVKSLARTGAPHGVTVNAVAPGAVDTEMLHEGLSPEDAEEFKRKILVGRFAEADELAGPTAFLLSSWARYITGATLHVNGGQLMV